MDLDRVELDTRHRPRLKQRNAEQRCGHDDALAAHRCPPGLDLYPGAVDNVFSPSLAAQPRRILCGYPAPRRVGDDRIAQQWNHGGG